MMPELTGISETCVTQEQLHAMAYVANGRRARRVVNYFGVMIDQRTADAQERLRRKLAARQAQKQQKKDEDEA